MVVECIVIEELEVSIVEGKSPWELLEYAVEIISKIDPNFKKDELKQVKLLGKQNEITENRNQVEQFICLSSHIKKSNDVIVSQIKYTRSIPRNSDVNIIKYFHIASNYILFHQGSCI